ncbi:MAG: hypothetical protein HY890_00565 [Deltaproteobacteria bacterium]|nr:hypothetical protein [Deltaproteobacteria bacterium]
MEKEFREIVKVLKEARRLKYIHDFALTGALALLHPRATEDMDFLISIEKENIGRFVDWLKFNKPYNLARHHAGRPKDRIKDLIEVPAGSTRADLIVAHSEVEKEAIATASPVSPLRNVKLKVVRPEYLIILKLRAGSDQDYIDGARLWNESIDRRLVRRMAKKMYMERGLEKLAGLAKRLP